MSVKSAQNVAVDFTTRRFDTGVATAADSTPTGTLVVNGTDNAATVTVTSKTGGKYKAEVTLPTLVLGDIVQLRMTATVNSVSDNAVIWTDTCDFDATAVEYAVWEGLHANHTNPDTFGLYLDGSVASKLDQSSYDVPVIFNGSGTATAGGASTITLQTTVGVDDICKGCTIKITLGTGLGQARTIVGYVNSTKVVTVDRPWIVQPVAGSQYKILYENKPKLDASLQVTPTDVGAAVALAPNQHVIVDSGTVTTLTNLPTIPANWLTAAGIAAGALNSKGDWLLAGSYTSPPSAATVAAAVNATLDRTGFALAANGLVAIVDWNVNLHGYYLAK